MNAQLWMTEFMYVCNKSKGWGKCSTCGDWTGYMGRLLDKIAKRTNCYVVRRNKESKYSGEYLNIDGFFFSKLDYRGVKRNWDPFVLPVAAVELENSLNKSKISYCLWKLYCIRTSLRILICYQINEKMIIRLKKDLENIIIKGNLDKRDPGQLLVIVGDGSKDNVACAWESYFRAFIWKNNELSERKWSSVNR